MTFRIWDCNSFIGVVNALTLGEDNFTFRVLYGIQSFVQYGLSSVYIFATFHNKTQRKMFGFCKRDLKLRVFTR